MYCKTTTFKFYNHVYWSRVFTSVCPYWHVVVVVCHEQTRCQVIQNSCPLDSAIDPHVSSPSIQMSLGSPNIPYFNSACRAVTGCLKLTNVEDLYLLAGIAPPDIRRYVCARVEKTKQETNEAHSLYGQNPAERRLESKIWFLRSVKPADFPPKVIRCSAWLRRLQTIPHRATGNIDERI